MPDTTESLRFCIQCVAFRSRGQTICDLCGTPLFVVIANIEGSTESTELAGDSPSIDDLSSSLARMLEQLMTASIIINTVAGAEEEGSRPAAQPQLCDATLQSFHRTNLSLDPSILYRCFIRVGAIYENAAVRVVECGQLPLPLKLDRPFVQLTVDSETYSLFGRGKRALATTIDAQSAIVILKKWQDAGIHSVYRVISELQEVGATAIIMLDDSAFPFLPQFSQYGPAFSIPVVLMEQHNVEVLQAYEDDLNGNDFTCSLTIESAMQSECCICFERMDIAMRLPECGHHIHETCGERWLRQNASCPFCRQKVRNLDG